MASTTHAEINDTWTWRLISAPDGWGGTQWAVITDRMAQHPGNFVPAIDLSDVDPDALEEFAEQLRKVAACIRSENSTDDGL